MSGVPMTAPGDAEALLHAQGILSGTRGGRRGQGPWPRWPCARRVGLPYCPPMQAAPDCAGPCSRPKRLVLQGAGRSKVFVGVRPSCLCGVRGLSPTPKGRGPSLASSHACPKCGRSQPDSRFWWLPGAWLMLARTDTGSCATGDAALVPWSSRRRRARWSRRCAWSGDARRPSVVALPSTARCILRLKAGRRPTVEARHLTKGQRRDQRARRHQG